MKSSLELKKLYESAEFNSVNIYKGNDLGSTYKEGGATFKVWAPVADKISVNIYEKGTPEEEGDQLIATKTIFFKSSSRVLFAPYALQFTLRLQTLPLSQLPPTYHAPRFLWNIPQPRSFYFSSVSLDAKSIFCAKKSPNAKR